MMARNLTPPTLRTPRPLNKVGDGPKSRGLALRPKVTFLFCRTSGPRQQSMGEHGRAWTAELILRSDEKCYDGSFWT